MSLIKHLTKHGNSYALIIDKPILDLLNIDPSTPLQIETMDGKTLIITPKRGEIREKAFQKGLSSINKKYSKALKKLAK